MKLPVVFLPGLLCDHRTWAAQRSALADHDPIVLSSYGEAASITAMAHHVLAVAPDRMALVGHSMGGRVALEIMRIAPHRVERLALLDTGIHPRRPGEAEKRHNLVRVGRQWGMAALVDQWLPPMVHPDRGGDADYLAGMRAMAIEAGVDRYEREITALLGRPDAEPVLRTIRCPTLIGVGRQDVWSPLDQHERMANLIPDAELSIFEDSGHMAPMEAADQVTAALRRWLERPSNTNSPTITTSTGDKSMSVKSLEDLLQSTGNTVELLRNQKSGPNVYPGVPPEFTNWRDEQRAWQETAVLFNQSYHMADLLVEGPDAFKMLNYLGINSFKGFTVDKAKQFVPCTPEGYVIGDVILFYLAENSFNLVGRAPTLNWIKFHAETGDWDVTLTYDERSAARPDPFNRKSYRFQVQGPNAAKVMTKATGAPAPDLKFFNMTTVTIGGKEVRALRHGMAGQPGYELFGPWADGEAVREALVAAGEEFGLRQVGGRAYSSNTLESGWIPSPLPAIYTGESLKAYREWLGADSYEAKASIGGSFVSDNVEDYYLTPWDLGYGPFVKFDHDFIGREALEKMAAAPQRKKVTLALENDEVLKAMGSMFQKTGRAKFFEFPSAVYSMHPYDRVTVDGKTVGISTWIGYSSNEGRMLTLAMLDAEYAEPGTEVSFVWGEEDGGTAKLTVEPHVQVEIKAIVSPVPYAEVAREAYAEGWRTRKEA